MIAGCTVTVILSDLPLPISKIASLKVVYRDAVTKESILSKDLTDMTRDGDTLRFTLTQSESLSMQGKLLRSVVLCSDDGVRAESVPDLVEVMPSAYGEVLS